MTRRRRAILVDVLVYVVVAALLGWVLAHPMYGCAPRLPRVPKASALTDEYLDKLKAEKAALIDRMRAEQELHANELGRTAAKASIAVNARRVAWMGGIAMVVAGVSLLASFVFTVIPRRLPLGAAALAVVCWFAQYALLAHGVWLMEALFWTAALAIALGVGSLILGVAHGWRKRRAGELIQAGRAEAAQADSPVELVKARGKIREGVAIAASVDRWVDKRRKSLAEFLEKVPGMDTGVHLISFDKSARRKLGIKWSDTKKRRAA